MAPNPADNPEDTGARPSSSESAHSLTPTISLHGSEAVGPALLQPDHESAFSALESLFEVGKISGSQTAELRAIYGRMATELEHKRSYEKSLVEKARVLSDDLDQQRLTLNKCDDQGSDVGTGGSSGSMPVAAKPDTASAAAASGIKSNETVILRKQLMKRMNEISMLEERNQEDSYTIEVLTEHRRLMQLEKDRQPDPAMLEKQAEDLNHQITVDVTLLHNTQKSIASTNEHNEQLEGEIKETQMQLEQAVEAQDQVTADLVANSTVDGMHPAELARCIDKLGRQREDLDKQVGGEDINLKEVSLLLKEKLQAYELINEQVENLKKMHQQNEGRNENKEREYAAVNSDLNRDKMREGQLVSRREDLEINQRQLDQEKNHHHDQISRKKREFDRESRALKKKMLQHQQLTYQLEQLQQQYEQCRTEFDNFPRDEQGEKERRDLTVEVEMLKKRKLGEEAHTRSERDMWENLIETINNLSKEQEKERTIVNEQGRMLHLKTDEREQKAREEQRAKNRLKQVLVEKRSKELELLDHKKRATELTHAQEDFAKKYEQIKNEKNKQVNLIQASSQKREELKDKLRILANEIEVLQQRLNTKDKELAQAQLKNSNAESLRDQFQAKINKSKTKHALIIEDLDQAKLTVSKLTNQNALAEEEMLKLRKKYESAVNSRNQRGIQLIEREEEVCVFYEKLNIQENVIRKGDVKMEEFNDEVSFLKTQVAEERRQVDILRKYRPTLKSLKNELVDLQIELAKVQDKTVKLERKLENPDACKDRIRFLDGDDLGPDKLENKLAELELRLAQKEEQSLEKSLIFEQVQRLLNNLQEKQAAAVDDKRVLADQLADTKAKLTDQNRKTIALISEIAMEQSKNCELQHQLQKLDTTNELANERFARGEPPSEKMMDEWKKRVRDERRRHEDKLHEYANLVEIQKHLLPGGGGVTTAEPRPNAYLTTTLDDGISAAGMSNSSQSAASTKQSQLPVPKPYGSMAPFKPQPQGAQMRHIRKPKAKPLEI